MNTAAPPLQPPRPRRYLGWAAIALALAVLALAGTYVLINVRAVEDSARERLTLYTRVLERETATRIDSVARSLDALEEVLAARQYDTSGAAFARYLTDSLTGHPEMRSLAVLDASGTVLASSDPAAVGVQVDLQWADGPAEDLRKRLGPRSAGRGLGDTRRGDTPRSRVGTIPMVQRIARKDRAPLILLALINPDLLETQFSVLAGDVARRSAVFSYDGQLLIAGPDVPLEPGRRQPDLPAFTEHLPTREAGAYIGKGMNGEDAVTAYHTVGQWPLVVLTERSYTDLQGETFASLTWLGLGTVSSWLVIAGVFVVLRRDERLQRHAFEQIRQAHAELRDVETRWKIALESAGHGVWDLDLRTGRFIVSPTLAQMLGIGTDEMVLSAETWRLTIHPDDAARSDRAFQAHLRGEMADFNEELRLRVADGSWRWASVRGRLTREQDAGGHPVRMIGTTTDITQRKATENALRASEARQHAILDSAHDAIVSVDIRGRIIDYNRAAEAMFGYRRQDVIGRAMNDVLVPHRFRESHGLLRFLDVDPDQLARRLHRQFETKALHASGNEIPVELTIVPVDTGDTRIFTVTLRNVAERLRIYRELAAARQREIEIGNRIQQSLLVTAPPSNLEGLSMSAFSQSSTGIDGDFFEVIRINDQIVDVIAGDVMGKGVPAALLGAATKLQFSRSLTQLLALIRDGGALPDPRVIVTAVNREMTPHLQAIGSFVTLTYLRVDLADNHVTWVGCGNEEPLHVTATGERRLLSNQHPPLGLFVDEDFAQDHCSFAPGDLLFMCSDGATDALKGDGDRVGRDAIHDDVVRRAAMHGGPAMLVHGLRQDLMAHHATLTDDLTLAALVRHDRRRQIDRIEMPVSLGALAHLREFVDSQGLEAGLPEDRAAMLTVAAVEVMTNVIRHAQGLVPGAPVELIADRDRNGLELSFTYLGDDYTPPAEAPETDFGDFPEGGFGLYIINQACDEVVYDHQNGINIVRLTVRT